MPIPRRLSRFRSPPLPRWTLALFIVALAAIYTLVATHTPLPIYTTVPHDDGWFIAAGRYLADGDWLGPFNPVTLMKGPGYPAFLALGQWLGMPLSLAEALLRCAAASLLVYACHRLTSSVALSALLLILLLWHPIPLTVYLLRVIRDAIYYSQSLLVFAAAVLALFVPILPRAAGSPDERSDIRGLFSRMSLALMRATTALQPRAASAMFGGAALGWLWLTREEGIWILPGLAVLLAFATARAIHQHELGKLGATVLLFVATFAATQILVASINRKIYGAFVTVDMKESNFERALAALASVRSGGVRPYVVVTYAARQRIYPVSPSFAELAEYLDSTADPSWARTTCRYDPSLCGEIGSGWFLYALRDAAAVAGHYGTAREASAFFAKLADEIDAACYAHALECSPQAVWIMPPVDWPAALRLIPPRVLYALELLTFYRWPLHVPPSSGNEEELRAALRLLNYPVHTPSPQMPVIPATYRFSGWYYRSGDAWVTVTLRTQGPPGEVRVERNPSPDVAEVFKDPAASHQRFIIQASCSDDCGLQFEGADGGKAEKRLAGLRHTPVAFGVGEGRVHIDKAELLNNVPLRSEELSATVRAAILSHYGLLYIPALAIGALAFALVTVLRWTSLASNACYVVAFAAWVMVLSRTGLLVFLDVTTFPGVLEPTRLAPAYFFAACAAVMSAAACLQLLRKPL